MIEKACDKSVAIWEMEKSFKDKKGDKKNLWVINISQARKFGTFQNGKQNSIEEN